MAKETKKSAKVKMLYDVSDVEHMGDVNWEEHKLTEMGADIIDTDIEWGSEEIEYATIIFYCEADKVAEFEDYGACKY